MKEGERGVRSWRPLSRVKNGGGEYEGEYEYEGLRT